MEETINNRKTVINSDKMGLLECDAMTGHGLFGMPAKLQRQIGKVIAVIALWLSAYVFYTNDTNLWWFSLICIIVSIIVLVGAKT